MLRAFAMFLGVVLHAALFLMPTQCWPVQTGYADSTDLAANPYGYAFVFIHGFRMPVFFMLSGFFTAMLWRRRGLRALGKHRLERVGLPLAVALITVIPVTHWVFGFAADRTGKELADWCAAVTWPPLAWMGGFYHLWFLRDLLLMAAAFIVLAWLGLRFRSGLWWLLVPLTLAPQYFMRDTFGADISAGAAPDPMAFAYYSTFFLFGVFFYATDIRVRRWWTVAILPALLVFPPGLAFAHADAFGLDASAAWVNGVAAALQVAFSWAMCFGLMGLFRWIVPAGRAWMRYLSDASYWVYLWHVPLVVAGQWLIADWSVSAHLKYLLVCLVVPAVLLAIYRHGVRYTVIGTMLNGPRRRPAAQGATPC